MTKLSITRTVYKTPFLLEGLHAQDFSSKSLLMVNLQQTTNLKLTKNTIGKPKVFYRFNISPVHIISMVAYLNAIEMFAIIFEHLTWGFARYKQDRLEGHFTFNIEVSFC